MKIRVHCKDPDGFYEAVEEAATKQADDIPRLLPSERQQIIESRREQIREKLSKWVQYGECVEIEFDLDAMTATVKHPDKE